MAAKDAKQMDAPLDDDDPAEDRPSELDPLTHAEFIAQYEDAGENIRFAKLHQWRMLVYFTAAATLAVIYGHASLWREKDLLGFILFLVWGASVISILIICSLQWWQSNESEKIQFIKSKWSSFTGAASKRKSKLVGDIHRYGMLLAMVLYIEMVTFAVSRIYWPFM